jgi:transcription elongation factor SPT6
MILQDVGELDSRKDSPEVVAANFTCAMFEMPKDVLRGARHMVFNRPQNIDLFCRAQNFS